MKNLILLMSIVIVSLFLGCVEKPLNTSKTSFVKKTKAVEIDIKNLTLQQKNMLKKVINDINIIDYELGKVDSVKLSDFQNKKYLTIYIKSNIAFNSIKFSQVTLGKYIFENYILSITPKLNKLNSVFPNVYGYEIYTIVNLRNFVNDYDLGNILVYQFYLPKEAVKDYVNYKITDKQLANKSIILVNKHRISIF